MPNIEQKSEKKRCLICGETEDLKPFGTMFACKEHEDDVIRLRISQQVPGLVKYRLNLVNATQKEVTQIVMYLMEMDCFSFNIFCYDTKTGRFSFLVELMGKNLLELEKHTGHKWQWCP